MKKDKIEKFIKNGFIKFNCKNCIHYPDKCKNYKKRKYYACSMFK